MNTYPTFGQELESTVNFIDETNFSRSSTGSPLVRSFYTTLVREFLTTHTLTTTEKDELLTFYTTNRNSEITFNSTLEGSSYTCVFVEPPAVSLIGGSFWKVSTKLAEVI